MAEAFHQDLTCSICLDLFIEPVLLSCGHCFCKKCIFFFWESKGRDSSCPECRAPCPDRQHTPNRVLGNLAKRAWDMQQETNTGTLLNMTEVSEEKERKVGREDRQHTLHCEIHGDSLELFCTIDEVPICCRCIRSSVHAGHNFVSLKDGTQSYKIKLAEALEPLERKINELEEHEGSQKENIESLKRLAISLHADTEAKFSELHEILCQRQAEMLAKLEKDEKEALKDMVDRLEQIQEKLCVAKEMMTEGKGLMELKDISSFLLGIQPFLDKLQAKKAAHCEGEKDDLAVLCKKLSVGKFKGPIQHLACRPLLPLFAQELQPVQLDHNTAHPLLKIMDKETRVITGTERMFSKQYLQDNFGTVFAKNGFHSGRHYWEIETEGEARWLIGVAAESIKDKKTLNNHSKDKIWVVQVLPRVTGISMRVGVYLDYEEGQVSFYKTSDGSHMGTHMARFQEKVYPFFATEPLKKASLTICQK